MYGEQGESYWRTIKNFKAWLAVAASVAASIAASGTREQQAPVAATNSIHLLHLIEKQIAFEVEPADFLSLVAGIHVEQKLAFGLLERPSVLGFQELLRDHKEHLRVRGGGAVMR